MFLLRITLMALRSLQANLLRSLLATIGVVIGVGAVISANAVLSGVSRMDDLDKHPFRPNHIFPCAAEVDVV